MLLFVKMLEFSFTVHQIGFQKDTNLVHFTFGKLLNIKCVAWLIMSLFDQDSQNVFLNILGFIRRF